MLFVTKVFPLVPFLMSRLAFPCGHSSLHRRAKSHRVVNCTKCNFDYVFSIIEHGHCNLCVGGKVELVCMQVLNILQLHFRYIMWTTSFEKKKNPLL